MNSILDSIARGSSVDHHHHFHISSSADYFAFRLADNLNEASAAAHYRDLLKIHSEGHLLVAYGRAVAHGPGDGRARRFHAELVRLGQRSESQAGARRLAAIRIERRTVAVAIMAGTELEYPTLVRHLPAASDKAIASAAIFVERVIERRSVKAAALETLPTACIALRSQLLEGISGVLTEKNVSIWRVSKREVLSAFGFPRPRFRNQIREVISRIWPDAADGYGGPLIQDALALGLYCQTERLFNSSSQNT